MISVQKYLKKQENKLLKQKEKVKEIENNIVVLE